MKTSPGRHDCNLCAEHTIGQDVALFYRLDMETGLNHVVLRAHMSHFDPAKTSPAAIIRHLEAVAEGLSERARTKTAIPG